MPRVPFNALLGPSYTMFSEKAEIQKALNTYRQRVESNQGAGPFVLLRSPGLRPLFQPTGGPGVFRGGFALNDQALIVIDNKLYNLDSSTHVNFVYAAAIANDGKLVRMAASPISAMFVSAGILYRANGGVITLPVITFVPVDIFYINNTFGAIDNQQKIYWSTDDGITWDPAHVQTFEASANNLVAAIVQSEILYIYGNQMSQPYIVGSNPNAVFVPQQSGIVPMGLEAADTLQSLDRFRYWLGVNKEGSGSVYRSQGYDMQRISNLALENFIRIYERDFGVANAFGMTYGLGGQDFYRITFPEADASWEFNISISEATGIMEWEQVAHFDMATGLFHRHRANMILPVFGKILVGDYQNGWLYELTPDEYTDYGYPLPFIRRAPHIIEDNLNVSYERLDLGAETGVGLAPPLWLQTYSMQRAAFVIALAAQVASGAVTAGQALVLQSIYDREPYTPLKPYPLNDAMNTLGFAPWGGPAVLNSGTVLGGPPTIGLRYSSNGGKSYTQPLYRSMGMPGDDPPIHWDQLGIGPDKVLELSGDHPCRLALTTAFIDATELMS